MEKNEYLNKKKASTLSVDVEPFVPRHHTNRSSCENVCTTSRNVPSQRPQGIPPYITSCYPFVQEDPSGSDYKNSPWSTYVPPQFSFHFSGLQASAAQRCSYSRYPSSQLSPRYNTGFYTQFKQDNHYTWDDRDRNWTRNWKHQDTTNYRDLQQQETYGNKPLYRKFKSSKDSQKDGSETSSTDLSSQSSSHTRTLGDFFPSMKSVKRSKSLPNSAAKLELPRGNTFKNKQMDANDIKINEWPTPSDLSTDTPPRSQYVLSTSLNKRKSFADVIKTMSTEPKTSLVQVQTNTMSSDELKSWNKNFKHDLNVSNKPRADLLRTRVGKTTQFFQQPKYYTDISPRYATNTTFPTTFNENSEMRGSASCTDIRSLCNPRSEVVDLQRRGFNRPLPDNFPKRGNRTSRENVFYPHYEEEKHFSMIRQPMNDKPMKFVHDSGPGINAMNCGGRRPNERPMQDSKNSVWQYPTRFRNWGKAHQEWSVDNPNKYSKEKTIYPMRRDIKPGPINNFQLDLSDIIENVETDLQTSDGECTFKKKKLPKEKNQSKKNQLAAAQGKMVLLSPEMYSKLMAVTNRQGTLRERNTNSRLDNDDDYPEFGSHLSKESTPRLKRVASITEDDEWSDVDSDYDLVEGVLNSPGRSYRTPRSYRDAAAQPLSYHAAVKQSKDDGIKVRASPALENSCDIINDRKKRGQTKQRFNSCAFQEVVQLRGKQNKPKKNPPIQFNVNEMLLQSERKKRMKKGKLGFPINKWTRQQARLALLGFPMVANILDSTAPMRRRGKERELPPKKHPSALKKIILREREEKKKIRQMEEQNKTPRSVDSDVEVLDSPPWDAQCSTSSTAASICGGADDEYSKKLVVDAASIVHSRRFREYCDHILSPDIDSAVTRLLQDLIRFHTRLYHKDPVKAKSKRRVVLGLREVTKHLKLKRLKCIILAPNLDRIQSKGGLDDAIESIINLAKEQQIPYVFALGRKMLGRVCYKQVPVSCVGIFNYSGAEANFNQLMELVAHAQVEYKELVARAEMECQRMIESFPKPESFDEDAPHKEKI